MQQLTDGAQRRNKRTGEVQVLRGGQWVSQGGGAPSMPSVIEGPPKEPSPQTPAQAQSDQLTVDAKGYDVATKPVYDRANAVDKVRDGYRQDKRILKYEEAIPVYISALQSPATPEGDTMLVNAFAKTLDPATGVQQREGDQISGAQPTFEQLKARALKEFGDDGAGNFTPEGRKRLREAVTVRMRNLADQGRAARAEHINYIKSLNLPDVDPEAVVGPWAGTPFQKAEGDYLGREPGLNVPVGPDGQARQPIDPNGTGDIGFNQERQGNPLPPEKQALYDAWWKANPNPSETQLQQFAGSIGLSNWKEVLDAKNAGAGVRPGADAVYNPDISDVRKGGEVMDPILRGTADVVTMGLSEELAAIPRSLSTGESYDQSLAYENKVRDYDQENNFGKRLGGQLGGGLALPTFGAKSIPQFAKVGAGYGAAYGGGSADGNLGQRGVNALLGAAGGAAAGAAIPSLASVVKKGAMAAGRRVAANTSPEQKAILQAADEEQVPVNMGDIYPNARNALATLETIPGSSGPVRSGLQAGEDAIQGRVNALADGGTALEPATGGDTAKRIGERYISKSGKDFNQRYGRLEQAAGSTKVPATNATKVVDEVIGRLSELGNTNNVEVSYLKGLKTDLGKDLSIGALRRLRTTLRKKIAKGDLTFGEDEASVLSIMDAAADDIANGLSAQGRGNIATEFSKVDRDYRDRMQFIKGTVQKIVGKRDGNVSSEQVFANMKAMTGPKGDAAAFGRFLREAEPEERLDIQATFAEALGKNNKGEFSLPHLAAQIEKMPRAMRVSVFGEDGAKSLQNLLTLSNAKSGMVGRLNNSRSGQVSNFRTVISSVLLGLPGGGAFVGLAQQASVGAGATGAAVGATAGAAGLGVSRVVAKALMNEEFTRALANAPATANPQAINAHVGRLRKIAARDPNVRQVVVALEEKLLKFANDNMARSGRAAASPDEGPEGKEKRRD